jgi:hypothetical protein
MEDIGKMHGRLAHMMHSHAQQACRHVRQVGGHGILVDCGLILVDCGVMQDAGSESRSRIWYFAHSLPHQSAGH